jgi:branched-chain amino acid transport system substrate-binding protein
MINSHNSGWHALVVVSGTILVTLSLGVSSVLAAPRPEAVRAVIQEESLTVERVAKGTTSTDKKTKLTTQKQTDRVVTKKVVATKGSVATKSSSSTKTITGGKVTTVTKVTRGQKFTTTVTTVTTERKVSMKCPKMRGVSDNEIKIGTSQPLSGPAASIGKSHLTAQEAFVERLNARGGVWGRKIKLVSQDDGFAPERAVANAQFLIDREKVAIIWGNVGTAPSVASMAITEAARVPFLFPYSLSRTMTSPKQPYTFSMATPAYNQNIALSNLMVKSDVFKGKKIGLMVINSPDGIETVDGFKAGASASQIVLSNTYERNSVTFKAQLLAFKAAGAEIVYLGVNDTQFAKAIVEANEIGFKPIFFGSTGVVSTKSIELSAGLAEGAYSLVFTAPLDSTARGIGEMNAAVKKFRPKDAISTFSVHGWGTGLIVQEALLNAGPCITSDTIKTALEKLKNFDPAGLTGAVSFTKTNHLGNRSVILQKVEGGKWITVGKFIK